jgi:hypothetical protein
VLEIKYHFANSNYPDIAKADETTLRYNLFLGSLIFKNDIATIPIDWDWIPYWILQFAY